jgi:cob(I)alamin adenosyltransferase
MSKLFNKQNFEYGKQIASGIGQAINKVKTKINKTKLDKANSTLGIAKQKLKAGKAKLDQTVFEIKNKMPITFKSKNGKSESNTESYKRITGENNKVIKGMLDKAAGKK